jgi:hypothetical protein
MMSTARRYDDYVAPGFRRCCAVPSFVPATEIPASGIITISNSEAGT